ncbi:MAG: YdcF family protein [Rubrobacter sp.]
MRIFVAAAQTAGDWFRLLRVFSGGRVCGGGSETSETPGVAVVLGAQVLSGGRPSGTLRARTLHAARMYDEGRVSSIVVTGGVGENPPSEAEVMTGILIGSGVPASAVVEEGRARTTWESAVYVSRMMRQSGTLKVVAVTDPLHCGRTVAAFEERGLRATPEPVYGSPSWRVGKLRVEQLMREMGASPWYRVHHGVGSRTRHS